MIAFRQTVAKTILALNDKDKASVAKIYRDNGYSVTFRGDVNPDDAILHRFASFHLDSIDLSPLKLDNGETIEFMDLMKAAQEKSTPSFVEEGRRLGGLLMGVCAQAVRPISLAKEWKSIAQKTLSDK